MVACRGQLDVAVILHAVTGIDRLAAARTPVIAVVAPPGNGKTTLLAQWAERAWPRVAWVSCDDGDNDPVVLLSALAVALDGIETIDPMVFRALASSGAGITVVPGFVSAIASMHLPTTLVLDHTEAVTNKECLTRSPSSPCASRVDGSSRWPLAPTCRIGAPAHSSCDR
jgi:LuxR family maltose regulon positive regulatory protein